ncbi:hypothetical protein M0812_25717 [Anaeramoeba flamelloides]|uniref:BTB domain-containing protein n=1 Tax=Anaeramoeba flamelloides TaxID=1746091 RepID=A0AAV7YHT5_9EUKA|nr:hypothetical protein M0812_25717 [Anaeramoeba flamelloides]
MMTVDQNSKANNNFHLIDLENFETHNLQVNGDSITPRWGHRMVKFDQYLVIFGGFMINGKYLNDLYYLNLQTNNLKQIETIGKTIKGMSNFSFVRYKDFIYLFGGRTSLLGSRSNEIYKYNFKNKEWIGIEPIGEKPLPRSSHSTTIYNNKLYVYGGMVNKKAISDLWYFDLESEIWVKVLDDPQNNYVSSGISSYLCKDFGYWVFYGGSNKNISTNQNNNGYKSYNNSYGYNNKKNEKNNNNEKEIQFFVFNFETEKLQNIEYMTQNQKEKPKMCKYANIIEYKNKMLLFGGEFRSFSKIPIFEYLKGIYQLSFESELVSSLRKLLNTKKFADFSFQSKSGKKYSVHKILILCRLINKRKYPTNHNTFLNLNTSNNDDDEDIEKKEEIGNNEDIESIEETENIEETESIEEIENIEEKILNNFVSTISQFSDDAQINHLINWFYLDTPTSKFSELYSLLKLQSKKSTIQDDMKFLYEQNYSKNFSLIVNNQAIKVHDWILFSRSGLYHEMFNFVSQKINKITDYSGKSLEVMEHLVYFFYTGEIKSSVSIQISLELLKESEEYFQLPINSLNSLIFTHLKKNVTLNDLQFLQNFDQQYNFKQITKLIDTLKK